MALVDTTVEQSVVSSPGEGPGDASVCCVRMGPLYVYFEGVGVGGEIGDGG